MQLMSFHHYLQFGTIIFISFGDLLVDHQQNYSLMTCTVVINVEMETMFEEEKRRKVSKVSD